MIDILLHGLIPFGIFLFLFGCLFLDCNRVREDDKSRDDSPCEIKDSVRGRTIFVVILCLLALIWILVPLKT